MPNLNSLGNVAHGKGGVGAFLNNVQFDDGGGADWLTNRDIAYQHCGADGCYVALYDSHTGQIRRAILDEHHPFYNCGANAVFAGGGVWAAWLNAPNNHGVYAGLYASNGLHLPAAGLVAVGPTGAIAYVPNRQNGLGVDVQELDGSTWRLTDGIAYDLQLIGRSQALWRNPDGTVATMGIPHPQTLPGGVWFPKAVLINDEWWLVYYSSTKGLVAHPFNSFVGYPILPSGDAWPDAVTLSDVPNTIRVAWSITEGEAAGHIRHKDINIVVDPRIDLGTSTSLPVDAVVSIGRDHALGFFCGSPDDPADSWKTNIDPRSLPGNMYMLRKDATLYTKQDVAFARYVQGGSVEEIEAQAAASPLPAVCYWDARTWPRWPVLPANAYLCVQAYWHVGESIEQFEFSIRGIVQDASNRGYNVCLVPQVYTSNSGNQSDLGSVCVVASRIARDYPRVAITLGFSGTGRQTGLWQHPEATPYWERYAAGLTGLPDFGQGDQVSAPNEFATVQQVAAEFPHLLQTNTIVSCTEFTQRVLERLNGEWGCVGKTAGEGQGKPEGFEPRSVRGVDGNMYLITGISYDVLFHAPSYRQVDMLGNATANEPGPWAKGPATPVWNEIEPQHYRANNPWIEKVPLAGAPPISSELPGMSIISFPTEYHRSELGGLVTTFEAARPVDGAFVDTIEWWLSDGAPRFTFKLDPPGGSWTPGEKDAPYFRTIGIKVDRNGVWNLFMRCRTTDGRWSAEVQGTHTVTVTE